VSQPVRVFSGSIITSLTGLCINLFVRGGKQAVCLNEIMNTNWQQFQFACKWKCFSPWSLKKINNDAFSSFLLYNCDSNAYFWVP